MTQWEHGSHSQRITKVVLIDTDNAQAINDVATLYKEMFNQDAVGHFTTPSMELFNMTQNSPMQAVYASVLRTYNPLEIKDILLKGASRKATSHKKKKDIFCLLC